MWSRSTSILSAIKGFSCETITLNQGLNVTSIRSSAYGKINPKDKLRAVRSRLSIMKKANENIQFSVDFMSKAFNCPKSSAEALILEYYFITNKSMDNFQKTTLFLSEHLSFEDVNENPEIFIRYYNITKQKYLILEQLGIPNITASNILQYQTIDLKPIRYIKTYLVPNTIEPMDEMLKRIDASPNLTRQIKKQMSTEKYWLMTSYKLRMLVLEAYLLEKLSCTVKELDHIMETYPALKQKGLSNIKTCLDVLFEHRFTPDKIKRNGYLLSQDPDEMRAILTMPQIGSQSPRDVAFYNPKILVSNTKKISAIEKALDQFKVTPKQREKCGRVYVMSVDTVYKRLKEVHENQEFEVLKNSDHLLYLVSNQNKVKSRMHLLKSAGFEALSTSILICRKKDFDEYMSVGEERIIGSECFLLLGKVLGRTVEEVRHKMSQHPKTRRFVSESVAKLLPALLERGLTKEQLWQSLPIFFYNYHQVLTILDSLKDKPELQPFSEWKGHPFLLDLVLYYIEISSNFSFDGIHIKDQDEEIKSDDRRLPGTIFLDNKLESLQM